MVVDPTKKKTYKSAIIVRNLGKLELCNQTCIHTDGNACRCSDPVLPSS